VDTIICDAQIFAKIAKILISEKSEILIATANLVDFEIRLPAKKVLFSDILRQRARVDAGVIRIVAADVSRAGAISSIRKVMIKRCPRNHAKMVIADRCAYFGSANLTDAGAGYRSLTGRNFEVGLYTEDPQKIEFLKKYFFQIWDGERCENCAYARKGGRISCEPENQHYHHSQSAHKRRT